jgi:O-antigen ligase
VKPETKTAGVKTYALVFGVFLGLCIWKFGNPVILDHKIATPATVSDFLGDAWPTHWANWILAPLAAWGVLLVFPGGPSRFSTNWLWLLPLAWLGWQFVSATQSVDADLTTATLWQYCGCAACYFLGARLLSREQLARWLLIGLLAAFAFCLVRAVKQRVFEYPQNLQALVEGERAGWTNFPPAAVAEMTSENIIIATNGLEVANPAILAKFAKGRVSGTLVYPNALAEIILLLWPVSLVLAFGASKQLRPLVRLAAIALTCFLGSAAFFWTGSKLGWLIGIGLAGLALLRLDWPRRAKFMALAAVLVLGLGIFAVRFHHYFAAGATSAGARFDYWRAAAQTTAAHPWFGTGPGTFQRPYAQLKSPVSEMARLAHNDYLEQFSDSGILGGLAYAACISLALTILGKKLWRGGKPFSFAIFLGLLGWFAQGLGEFGLFVPALAWTAFTLLGVSIGQQTQNN